MEDDHPTDKRSEWMSGFLARDQLGKDNIRVKRVFIDINDGNLHDGILFSQIVYWHMPDKHGRTRLRVKRDGYEWLAKNNRDWWKECRVDERCARDALSRIAHRGLIIKESRFFNGKKTILIRLNWEVFEQKVRDMVAIENPAERHRKVKQNWKETTRVTTGASKRRPTSDSVNDGERQIQKDAKRQKVATVNDAKRRVITETTPSTEITTPESTDVPPVATAPAVTTVPEPKIVELFQSVAPLVDAPTLPEQSEDPPSSAAPPAPHPPGQYVLHDGVLYGRFENYNAARKFALSLTPPGTTTQTPPRDLVAVPPAKPGRVAKADKPKLEQPPADVKDRFALLCYNGTEITGASWARLIKAWNRLEKPPADKFDRFARWWKACDWRGVKGQRPTPEQVVSEWDVAQNWDGATPVAVTAYQQNYRSKAELDAERNRINVQRSIEKARELQANSAPKDVSNLLAWKAELEAKRGKS